MTPQRYLAAIRFRADPQEGSQDERVALAAARQGFTSLYTSRHLALFISPGTGAIVLDDHRGAIVGPLFEQGGKQRLHALSGNSQAAILASGGQTLIDGYWGGYVALWEDRDTGSVHVLRDPSAMLPCYYHQEAGVLLIGSDVEILGATGLFEPATDWTSLARHLLAIQYRPSSTSLIGLNELLGGFRMTIDLEDTKFDQLWSPWHFGDRANHISDPRVAAARVRETTDNVITAWASCFEHIILGVSGGLDSSIVAAGLAASGVDFSCLTIATREPAGDERLYARAIAQSVDAPLYEAFFDLARVDLYTTSAAHLPRPLARSFNQEVDRISLELAGATSAAGTTGANDPTGAAGATGATGFFHGAGGDNVFCYLRSVTPIVDQILSHSPGLDAWQTLGNICRLTSSDVGTVGLRTLQRLWENRRHYRWPIDTNMLAPDAVAQAGLAFDHPWLSPPAHALPGTATHIAMLMVIQNYLEGYARERFMPVVAPLMSQPLVELCLQIPSWMWCTGGRNRAVARDAFADRLPDPILHRRSKGTPDSFAVQIFEARRPQIRALLLDGMLARHGLIDRHAVTAVLDDPRPARGTDYARILTLCDFEAWARSWS